jgi:hypothetical protein
MAYENVGGTFRHTILTIRKYAGAEEQMQAPYPLVLDIRLAFGAYAALGAQEFRLLSDTQYSQRLTAFYNWIAQTYPANGLNATLGAGLVSGGYDLDLCPIPVPPAQVNLDSSVMTNFGDPGDNLAAITTTLSRTEDIGDVTASYSLESSVGNNVWTPVFADLGVAFPTGQLTISNVYSNVTNLAIYRVRLSFLATSYTYVLNPAHTAPNWIAVTSFNP